MNVTMSPSIYRALSLSTRSDVKLLFPDLFSATLNGFTTIGLNGTLCTQPDPKSSDTAPETKYSLLHAGKLFFKYKSDGTLTNGLT